MRKHLLFLLTVVIFSFSANAQQCLNTGYCTTVANEHQYPAATFSTTSSTWTTVNAYMNADNYTLFNVTSGNTYEWSYCEAYGGVSAGWDAQLTLSDNSAGTDLCFSDNTCGTTGNAPYISWTATFSGVVKLLTTQANCLDNSGAPYNTLVWRMANGSVSTQILGIDVSHYDGTINWLQVAAVPKIFAWAKATEATNYTDPTFTTNMTNGEAAGVKMGGYHFAHPETNSASSEASYYLGVAGTYITSCELIPALDLEDPSGGPSLISSMTSTALTNWVQQWMTAVKNQTGITPVIYTNGSIASYMNSSVNTYPLWMADPDGSATSPPTNIGVWTNWAFKQYSWTGTVPGISAQVDLNVFNGNMTDLNTLMGCATEMKEVVSETDFILYPNPSSDHLVIENTSVAAPDEVISIYNIQGQVLFQQNGYQQTMTIDVSGFADGLYFVKMQTGSGAGVKKFVKR